MIIWGCMFMVWVTKFPTMARKPPHATCLFCGEGFADATDLFQHSGREHLRTIELD